MRNAALILGIIGGLTGMVVGFFGYGFAALGEMLDGFTEATREIGVGNVTEDPLTTKILAIAAPILAIAGAAMARSRPAVAVILLTASTLGMYHGFDFNVFTLFPIAMCGTAALFALIGAFASPVPSHD